MQRLAGVLFHVDARDADAAARPSRAGELDDAAGRERLLVLRDLIALRQVRIEVVLAREDRRLVDPAAERERRRGCAKSTAARFSTGSAPGKPEADRADVRVRRRAERRAAAAEDLRRGQELRVNFQADDGFVTRSSDRLLGRADQAARSGGAALRRRRRPRTS